MYNDNKAPAAGTAEANVNQANRQESPTHKAIVQQPGQEVKNYGPEGQIILPLLRSGRDNARKRLDLMAATGLRDRVFRKGVEALRRAGVVICSGEQGYYLPATLEEVQCFIRREEARAKSTFYTLQSARQLEAAMLAQGEQIRFSEVV